MKLGMSITQHEGDTHSYEQHGSGIVEEGFNKYEIPIEIKYTEIPELIGGRLLEKVDNIAEELARQTSQAGFLKIDQELTKVGNVVSAGGKPISQDVFFEMLEKMEMVFDDTGRPDITFVLHPETYKLLRPKMEEWQQDPEFQKRYSELISLKREAWLDRENNRKLVD